MKSLRTERQGKAMWKLFGHTKLHQCPECKKSNSLTYFGFAKNYMVGLHAKIYQCNECESWIDVVWEKYSRHESKDNTASV